MADARLCILLHCREFEQVVGLPGQLRPQTAEEGISDPFGPLQVMTVVSVETVTEVVKVILVNHKASDTLDLSQQGCGDTVVVTGPVSTALESRRVIGYSWANAVNRLKDIINTIVTTNSKISMSTAQLVHTLGSLSCSHWLTPW